MEYFSQYIGDSGTFEGVLKAILYDKVCQEFEFTNSSKGGRERMNLDMVFEILFSYYCDGEELDCTVACGSDYCYEVYSPLSKMPKKNYYWNQNCYEQRTT
jgi:hypothetical protein